MAALFYFDTTNAEYTLQQTHVYHDRGECSEGKKIRMSHRIDGSGGRCRCEKCAQIEAALFPKR